MKITASVDLGRLRLDYSPTDVTLNENGEEVSIGKSYTEALDTLAQLTQAIAYLHTIESLDT